jgi:urease accessory protein
LLAWDVLSLGLPAAQLPFQQGTLQQNWQWPGVWLEQAKIDANDHRLLHSPVGLAGHSTMATLLLATGSPYSRSRREHLLEHCRSIIEAHPLAQQCGATCPNEHVLLVRALASQVEPLMQLWQQLWAMLRREAWGMANVAPRIWSV